MFPSSMLICPLILPCSSLVCAIISREKLFHYRLLGILAMTVFLPSTTTMLAIDAGRSCDVDISVGAWLPTVC